MSYNSKYTGEEVESAIGKVKELAEGLSNVVEKVGDIEKDYVTQVNLNEAIQQAITTTLNTEV